MLRSGQSIVEYILLTAISVTALLASNMFLSGAPLDKALKSHFNTVSGVIKGEPVVPSMQEPVEPPEPKPDPGPKPTPEPINDGEDVYGQWNVVPLSGEPWNYSASADTCDGDGSSIYECGVSEDRTCYDKYGNMGIRYWRTITCKLAHSQ
jgi:hypothetical protein